MIYSTGSNCLTVAFVLRPVFKSGIRLKTTHSKQASYAPSGRMLSLPHSADNLHYHRHWGAPTRAGTRPAPTPGLVVGHKHRGWLTRAGTGACPYGWRGGLPRMLGLANRVAAWGAVGLGLGLGIWAWRRGLGQVENSIRFRGAMLYSQPVWLQPLFGRAVIGVSVTVSATFTPTVIPDTRVVARGLLARIEARRLYLV